MDIDYTIRKYELCVTETSILTFHELWKRSNRISVMFIKTKISTSIRGLVDQHDNIKELLNAIDEQFETSDKALASTLIIKFSSLRLTSVRGVREHIMQMRDIATQLKNLKVEMSKSFLVHYILNTLLQNNMDPSKSLTTHIRISGQLMKF